MDVLSVLLIIAIALSSSLFALVIFGRFALRPFIDTWTEVRKSQNEMLPLLTEIAAHTRSANGASLGEIVQALNAAAQEQRIASELTKANVATAHRLAVRQQETLQRLEHQGGEDQVTLGRIEDKHDTDHPGE